MIGTRAYDAASMFGGEVLPDTELISPKDAIKEGMDMLRKNCPDKTKKKDVAAEQKPQTKEIVMKEDNWKVQISFKIGGHMINVRGDNEAEVLTQSGIVLSGIQPLIPLIHNVEVMYSEHSEDDDDVEEDKTVPVYTPVDLGDVRCDKCGGPTWDNRKTKTNAKGPDFRCKEKTCNRVAWFKGGKWDWKNGIVKGV